MSAISFTLCVLSILYVFIKQSLVNKQRLNKYKKRIQALEKELSDLKLK